MLEARGPVSRRPRLGLPCYSNEVSRQGQSPGAKWELRGKKPVPVSPPRGSPRRRAHLWPGACALFPFHKARRNDLKVLVAECFAGKLLPKQPRVARGLWRGGRRVPLVRACDVGGRPWPRCPREAHWENFHRGNRWRGSFGWVEENNEPAFPGSRVPDLGCPCEACEYRSSHLSSPANLPPHRLFP